MVKIRIRLFIAIIVSVGVHACLFFLPAVDTSSDRSVNRSIQIQLINEVLMHSEESKVVGEVDKNPVDKSAPVVTPAEDTLTDIESAVVQPEEADIAVEEVLPVETEVILNSKLDAVLNTAGGSSPEEPVSVPLHESGNSVVHSNQGVSGGDESVALSSGPLIAYQVEPVYSLRARRRGMEGACVFRLTIGEDGALESIELVSSSGYDVLDQSARKALKQFRFTAASIKGVPIRSEFEYTVRFKLND